MGEYTYSKDTAKNYKKAGRKGKNKTILRIPLNKNEKKTHTKAMRFFIH